MSLPMGNYDPSKVVVSLFANIITGFSPDSIVKVAMDEDAFSLEVGAGGDSVRTMNMNRSGTITLSLLQTSPSNDVLSAAHLADRLTMRGYGPALVKDLSGRSLAAAMNAWVQKVADVEFGKEAAHREWTIRCERLDSFVGGGL